jgi:hypothetical protein
VGKGEDVGFHSRSHITGEGIERQWDWLSENG